MNELERWRESSRPESFYDDDSFFARAVRGRVDEALLREFGGAVATVVDPAVERCERNPPRLDCNDVVFDDAYAEAGRAVWRSGIVGAPPFEQAALLYLLAHAGEGGH